VLAAIIAPLPALLDGDFSFKTNDENLFSGGSSNDTYLNRIYNERYKGYELSLQNKLKAKGIDGVTVRINIAYNGGLVEIMSVAADVSQAVITSGDKNIDINMTVISTISAGLGVDPSKIIIVGGGG